MLMNTSGDFYKFKCSSVCLVEYELKKNLIVGLMFRRLLCSDLGRYCDCCLKRKEKFHIELSFNVNIGIFLPEC
jgi:hypothetical protein